MCTVLKLFQSFEGNHEADVTPGENEFDTPALAPDYHHSTLYFHQFGVFRCHI